LENKRLNEIQRRERVAASAERLSDHLKTTPQPNMASGESTVFLEQLAATLKAVLTQKSEPSSRIQSINLRRTCGFDTNSV
jgi:hypothetical protein